jgi:hypothetical protein
VSDDSRQTSDANRPNQELYEIGFFVKGCAGENLKILGNEYERVLENK